MSHSKSSFFMRKFSSVDLKLVVLGDASVGKTSIINRYCNDQFSEDTLSTIGAGFFTHTITMGESEVTLMVWDTAGEERFRSVAPSLLRGADGLILVYDVQSQQSFESLDVYMEMFLDVVNVSSCPVMPVLLLGNKADLQNFVVSQAEVDAWMEKNKVQFVFNVSAKTGEGVNEAFTKLVENLVAPDNFQDAPIQITPKEHKEGKTGCC